MGGSPLIKTQAPAPTKTEMADGIEFLPNEVKAKPKAKTGNSKLKITPKKAKAGTGVNKGY